MTNEQIQLLKDVLGSATEAGYHYFDQDQFDGLRALIAAQETERQEPVYMLRYLPGSAGWREADKAAFDSVLENSDYERRTLYTSPK